MKRIKSLDELDSFRERLRSLAESADGKIAVRVCCGTGCLAAGSKNILQAVEEEKAKQNLDIEIIPTGCQGLCERGPLLIVEPGGFFYQRVQVKDVPVIFSFSVRRNLPYELLLDRDAETFEPIESMDKVPFYSKQKRLVLKYCGKIDPCNIEHSIRVGGYQALQKVLREMSPEEVIEEVKRSGLRGRGGAGFPTGRKWEAGRKAEGRPKYVICNGDEGDPGAFMDRSILEGNPHSVLEGMAICGYAVGAEEGFIYVRHEYPLAVQNLTVAINQAEELGLLGEDILGTGFNFRIEIKEGAGAFVCGESTALALSIEGKRGMPKSLPRPRSTEAGLWDKPTILNNVETFANIPIIINEGADYFRSIGTEGSTGTKVFALTGKVNNTGLIEVPMGITLREIIFEIGGGILGGKRFKAVQTGGPSGGCLTEKHLDLPVDFDVLTEAGSMMGSGGMVVLDEDDCMVEVARYFMNFIQQESCGQCPPCRIGTDKMLEILTRITEGKGQEGDIETLLQLSEEVRKGSICGLGQSAPNPVLSTISNFREEYEAHIKERICPAGVCKGLGYYRIVEEECIQCAECVFSCPEGAIMETRDGFYIDHDICSRCKTCLLVCPLDAIVVERERRDAGRRIRTEV